MGDTMSERLGAPATMNADDTIKKQTKLYGLIAESASTNRLFVMLNKVVRQENGDAMMIPMNIREDDFYFTVSNMKKSHVNGAYIAQEYQEKIVELLDEVDEFVQVYGKCDFVVREGEKLIGTYVEKNGSVVDEALAQEIFTNYIKD
jgi:shikimate 5-dehydrogenase